MAFPVNQTYRAIDGARDQLITDADTGAILGFRSGQEQSMFNGVSDNASGFGSSLKTISGRNIVIPDGAQAVNLGGVTISSGSLTCTGTGELVTLAY